MSDFVFVTPRVATGAAVVDQAFVDALRAAGITHIVDATDTADDTPLLSSHPDMSCLWNPTADDGSPKDPSWFAKSLDYALAALARPHAKVYCHCSAGINRGPSTAYAVLRAQGFVATYALELIHQVRPQATVRYAPDADRAIAALGYE